MAKKEFKYQGFTLEELQKMSMDKFIKLLPSRKRRSLKRGLPPRQRKLMERVRKVKNSSDDTVLKTHCRDMIVLPEMVGIKIGIYNGREFNVVEVIPEMIGHYFGEFSITRKKVKHSAPGVGATRSSLYVPLK